MGNLHSAEIQLRGCGGGELEQGQVFVVRRIQAMARHWSTWMSCPKVIVLSPFFSGRCLPMSEGWIMDGLDVVRLAM